MTDERTHIAEAIARLDTARRKLGQVMLASGQEASSRAQIEAVRGEIVMALDEIANAMAALSERQRGGLTVVQPLPPQGAAVSDL